MGATCLGDASTAIAASWRIVPSIGVSELATDNVNLVPSNEAQSDLVTQITPTVTFSGIGARARVIGNIALPVLLYARTGSENNDVYPTAEIFGRVEAIERLFYVDGAISVTQPFLSPFGAQPPGLSNATENRYTQATYRISPYVRGTTPNDIAYELRNNSIWSNISSAPIDTSNSYTSEWIGRIDTPVAPLGWSAYLSAVDIKYSDQASQRLNVATFGPRYAYDPQLRFSLIGGYEANRFPFTDYTGAVYGGGVEWRPGPRTSVTANVEHRFFGTGYLANLSHRTPLSVWGLSASRSVTTYAQELTTVTGTSSIPGLLNQLFTSRIPNAETRQEEVDRYVQSQGLPTSLSTPVNTYSEEVLLAENFSASAGLLGTRNSAVRDAVLSQDGTNIGLGDGASWRIGRGQQQHPNWRELRLVAQLDAIRRAEFQWVSAADHGQFTIHRLYQPRGCPSGFQVPLSPKTTFITGVRYQSLGSDVSPGYTESAIFAGLNYMFR